MTGDLPEDPSAPQESDVLSTVIPRIEAVRNEVRKAILGQERVLDQMLITLLCGGHALLEGVPGTAKTLAVRAFALALSCNAKRIQFTPDLMPADIVGTNVYNLATNAFELRRGPIFTDLLLGDEINRAPAKTQSALLEGMGERTVTIDGVRHNLSPTFTVFATQNPIEFEGTYPLPEAQQDRFLMKIKVDYPAADAERAILEAVHKGEPCDRLTSGKISPVLTKEQMLEIQSMLTQVTVEPGVMNYVMAVVRATREHESILVGAGPRGSIFLLQTSKAYALLKGRSYLTPDDVVAMVAPVLGHRITLTADAEIQGATVEEILQSILDATEVPR